MTLIARDRLLSMSVIHYIDILKSQVELGKYGLSLWLLSLHVYMHVYKTIDKNDMK